MLAIYFLVPFIFTSLLYDSYELPKIVVTFVLLPLFFLIYFIQEKSLKVGFSSILLLVFGIWSLISGIVNYATLEGYPLKVLIGTARNLLSPPVIIAASLLFLSAYQIKNKERLHLAFSAGLTLLSLLAISNFLFFKNQDVFQGRSFIVAGNPVHLGSMLALGFGYILSQRNLSFLWKTSFSILLAFAIATTGTRSALLAAFISLIIAIFLSGKKREAYSLLASLAVLTTSYFLLFYKRIGGIVEEISNRLNLYMAALKGIVKRPIFGFGLQNFENFYRRLDLSRKYLNIVGEVPDSSHSALLDFTFSYGIVNFFFLIAFIVRLLFKVPAFALASLIVLKFAPANSIVWLFFILSSSLLLSDEKPIFEFSLKPKARIFLVAFWLFVLSFSTYMCFKFVSANYYYLKAVEQANLKNYDSTIRNFDMASSYLPNEPLFYVDKARFLLDIAKQQSDSQSIKNFLNSARQAIDSAIEVDPLNFESYILKTDILSLLGDRNSIDAGNAAVYLSPFDATAYYYRGISKATFGDYKEAIKDWKHAVRLKPDYTDAYYSLGYAFEIQKDFKEARKYYLKALDYAKSEEILIINDALKRIEKK
ncbi:MAG: O-antigen ligase family protein [Actinobacteria bacterium]|nr:O-antigen ligase family protein [Actinomycetota bacterium]